MEEYLPLGHRSHAVAPKAVEYLPGVHDTHSESAVPPNVMEYFPAMHKTHADSAVAPE
jgi:hypothetical protein